MPRPSPTTNARYLGMDDASSHEAAAAKMPMICASADSATAAASDDKERPPLLNFLLRLVLNTDPALYIADESWAAQEVQHDFLHSDARDKNNCNG